MSVTLKKRKPIVYISLALYAVFSTFIIAESCMGSSLSGTQSNFFAQISAAIVNFIEGPQIPESIKPTEVKLITDSSYLGKVDKKSQIAIGTTTLLRLEALYPEKAAKDVYDRTFEVIKKDGEGKDYNLVLSSSITEGHFYIDVRIVANAMSSAFYSVDVKVADTLTYNCPFQIVSLPAPDSYQMRLEKTMLKRGETAQIDVQFTGETKDDYYLRRYFDQTKLTHSSSNPAVATVDEYGVIRGVSQGEAIITYGEKTFNLTVNDENITKPASNELTITQFNVDKNPSLLDYDYVFEKDEEANAYSALLYADFIDETLEDRSVTWTTSDPLSVKLAPYAYDEDGYPIYHDEDGEPCVRACGYRTSNDTMITCVSNADDRLQASFPLQILEAKATSMKLSVTASSISMEVGDQKSVTATISPKNTFNKAINAVSSDPNVVKIKNNGSTSIALEATGEGTAHILITSNSNPSLKGEFDVKVKAKQVIDDRNYADFHTTVRKALGHFSLFLVTAIFGLMFFFTFFDTKKLRFALGLPITLASGFIIAGVSEWIQFYVPTRSGLWSDVWIDFSGYVAGTLLCMLVFMLIWFIQKKKVLKKAEQEEKE